MEDLITRTIDPCKAALKDAGVTAADIDEVDPGGWHDPNAQGDRGREGVFRPRTRLERKS